MASIATLPSTYVLTFSAISELSAKLFSTPVNVGTVAATVSTPVLSYVAGVPAAAVNGLTETSTINVLLSPVFCVKLIYAGSLVSPFTDKSVTFSAILSSVYNLRFAKSDAFTNLPSSF